MLLLQKQRKVSEAEGEGKQPHNRRRSAQAGTHWPVTDPPSTQRYLLPFIPKSEGLKGTVHISNTKHTLPALTLRTTITNTWPGTVPRVPAPRGHRVPWAPFTFHISCPN